MRVSEIIDYVILETGNYLVDTLVRQDINVDKFLRLVKSVLGEYTNYRPLRKSMQIYVDTSPYKFLYDESPLLIDKVNTAMFTTPGVLEDDPFRVVEREHIPVMPPWRYERPNLYITTTGAIDITGNFEYPVVPVVDQTTNEIIDYAIEGISYENVEFLQMVKAKFMITVGKQRRAFTANDLPIATDSSDIVSEGNDLWDKTKEQIQMNAKWWTVI